MENEQIDLGNAEPTDKDKIWALEEIIKVKESERKEWAEMCIKKQARIEELEESVKFYQNEIEKLSNKVAELMIVDSFKEGNGDIA